MPFTLRALLALFTLALLAATAVLYTHNRSAAATRSPTSAPAAEAPGESVPAPVAKRAAAAPNFLVIMVDDQSISSFDRRTQPETFRLLADQGTSFSQSYAVPPLCCPSRAGFQTGQYPHNHGVVNNNYGLMNGKDNILSTWLDAAGYNTGFVGKYMNGYEPVMGSSPAPGFDYWHALHGKPGYVDYKVSHNGRVKSYGDSERDYSTNMITSQSQSFLSDAAASEEPFFLWTSYYAPHNRHSSHPSCGTHAPLPLESDWRRWRQDPVELGPSFNERDTSDKPAVIRAYPRIDREGRQLAIERMRCTRAAMQPVDRGIADLNKTLRQEGLDRDTVVFYISDNGYFFGEHRKPQGKSLPYQEAMRVPMLARFPNEVLGTAAVDAIDEPVSNIDLAPTIVDLAGIEPCNAAGACRTMDGRSIADLVAGRDRGWPAERELLFELGTGCGTYRAVLRGSVLYTEWMRQQLSICSVAEREIYDLERDPHQLDNLFGVVPLAAREVGRPEQLSEQLTRLQSCAGIEDRDRQLLGRPFCG